ncbi:MAG TPA: GntR family transcriptional regulator [Verrucomicrobiales bacterium]|nr:GntR family transcriptional regulator [Verrucomicrobiales bacterium]
MSQPPPAASRKHLTISQSLREAIVAGKHPEGSRMPSEAQLVKRFGASRPTVARALRTLELEGLVARRAGSGTYATGEANGRRLGTRALALLIPDLRNTEIFQQIAGEIATLARVNDYSLIWGGSGQPKLDADVSLQHGEDLCEQFIAKRVDGVFFAPWELMEGRGEANARMAQRLHDAGIAVVLIDRDFLSFPRRSRFDLIGVDNLDGGFALGEHLIKLRCKSICFVHPPYSAPTVSGRIAGVRAAMDKHGLPWSANCVFEGNASDPAFIQRTLREGKPDALIGANDYTAALLLQSLIKLRIEVPQKVRVVGFDDVAFATLVSPALTTVQQPCREIALTAYRAMMERLADPTLPPRTISLSPRLIIRDSCGAYL